MSAKSRGSEYRQNAAYYTPDDLAVALVDLLPIEVGTPALEPHAGGGAFVRALNKESGSRIHAMDSDIQAEGLTWVRRERAFVGDFLTDEPPWQAPQWIVGNPPYGPDKGIAEAHIRRALNVVAPGGSVAFLLRLAMLESAGRAALWRQYPCRKIWVLTERPSFTGSGTDATAYGWFWWDLSYTGPTTLEVLSWRSH